MRPHGHVSVDQNRPRAKAVCDRCGFLYNHDRLQWQFQWQGPKLQNLKILVCKSCLDTPNEQLRTIIIPPDPPSIQNSRPENYTADNNPISPLGFDPILGQLGMNIGSLTKGAGLEAAFDSNVNKPLAHSAYSLALAGYVNTIGKNWNGTTTQPSPLGTQTPQTYFIASFTMTAPNNAPFLTAGAVAYRLEGSNDNSTWTALYSGTTAGTTAEEITATVSTGGAYAYHRMNFSGDGTSTVAVAQLQLNASA